MTQQIQKFKLNRLEKLALTLYEHAEEESKTRTTDITPLFWQCLHDDYLKNDDRIGIVINAKTRRGKSTIGSLICWRVHAWGQELGIFQHGAFGIHHIARNQTELAMLTKKMSNNIIMIDELRESENVGENITADEKYLHDFFNVQAAQKIHTVSISPQKSIDPTADIYLHVLGIDRESMLSHCLVSYRLQRHTEDHLQLIGYVNIDVRPIITTWIQHAKPLHEKHLMGTATPSEEKTLQAIAKRDWYTAYVLKKHEQIDIIRKYKITKLRTLEYATIIKRIITKLSPLVSAIKLSPETIKNYVKLQLDKEAIPTTILGLDLLAKEVQGDLDIYRSQSETLEKLKKVKNNDNLNGEKAEIIAKLQNVLDIQRDLVTEQEQEIERHIKAHEEMTTHIDHWVNPHTREREE